LVSGYALLRTATPERIVATAAEARAAGTSVAVDLSSAGMIRSYGAARFRALWHSLEPAVVLANDDEWAATNAVRESPSAFSDAGRGVLILKHGARGCTFVIHGVSDDRAPAPGPVVDVTGAGDALAAGYLLGGIELAMATAARCVAHVGAQPRP
jgi:sugar/nucleoside kinase (ribokinase family)